jgi:hypothetical protein
MDISREQYLQWCKDRALEYVKLVLLEDAIASMQSDLTKHPETNTPEVMKRVFDIHVIYGISMDRRVITWIHGFN